MTGRGGQRPGAGRKTKADEERVRTLAIGAIVKKYGSEEKGFTALLNSQEPTLIKLVFEHAYGKPQERIVHSGDPEKPVIFKADERFLND